MSIPVQSDILGFQKAGRGPDASRFPDLDLHAWNEALRQLPAAPETDDDVLAWVEGPLRRFFPFAKFWGAYGSLSGGRILMRSLLSSGHAPEYISGRDRIFALETRSCFAWWVRNRKAFIFDKTGPRAETGEAIPATRREFDDVERFSLGTVAAHGVIDPFMLAGTYFSFAGLPEMRPSRMFAAVNLIVPVLHVLYLQTKQAERSSLDLTVLTDRQRDLVDLALMGLSDKSIAARLEISDHTVGNHFRAIYAKLGISKRSQLIALLK
jgi:DNA-binding CsgD family transcriptional regulator